MFCFVQGLVELHGGTVGVFSQEGHGSTFFFELPLFATLSPEDEGSIPFPCQQRGTYGVGGEIHDRTRYRDRRPAAGQARPYLYDSYEVVAEKLLFIEQLRGNLSVLNYLQTNSLGK